MKKIKMLLVVLSLLLVVVLVAACSNENDDDTTPAATPTPAATEDAGTDDAVSDDGLVVLTAFHSDAAFRADTWGDDIVSQEMIARTGVTVEWEINAAHDDQTRENLMVASGEFPDMMFLGLHSLAAQTMMEDGLLYSWEELFNRYLPEAMTGDFMARNEQYLRRIWEHTDQIYTIPHGFADRRKLDQGTFLVQAPGYYVMRPTLEAIGNPPLRTLEDLENVLRLAVEHDPTIAHPLFLWNPVGLGWDANGILVIQRTLGGRGDFYINNGRIYNNMRDPSWREAVMFVHRMYNQGFISHQNFTDSTAEQEAVNNEGSWVVAIGHQWRSIAVEGLGHDVWNIPHLEEPGVTFYSPFDQLTGWNGFFIPRGNSNPEATARWLYYVLSDEGQALVHAGIEGQHFEWGGPDGLWIVPTGEGAELFDQGWTTWSDALGTYRYQFTTHAAIDSAFAWGLATGNEFLTNLYTINSTGRDSSAFFGIHPVAGTLEQANGVRIGEIVNAFLPQIITAFDQQEAERMFDQMMADVEASGLEGIEDMINENFARRNPGVVPVHNP